MKATEAPGSSQAGRIVIDTTYGGVYAGSSFEISDATARHFNDVAARATGVLPDEFVPLTPGLKFTVACPSVPMPRADYIRAWNRLRVVIDGEHEIRLAEYPRLYAGDVDDIDTLRGVPTYIPKSTFPTDFFGRTHSVELFQDDEHVFGPVERFFHTETSGAIFDHIEDAPGKLVLEVRGNLDVLAKRGEIVFFTDPAFGEPTAVVQVNDDGSEQALEWHMLGHDRIGDMVVFDEWVAVGVHPRGATLVVEVHLPQRATGVACALYSGHTRAMAYRADATVL